ncbi:MAG TPA: hypothetical protein VHB78_10880 [Vicinamibacterales bacterium]|nr:hypothetical protein [Vicinamibacterales bacterium]
MSFAHDGSRTTPSRRAAATICRSLSTRRAVNHAGKTRSPACGLVKLHTTYHVTIGRVVGCAADVR